MKRHMGVSDWRGSRFSSALLATVLTLFAAACTKAAEPEVPGESSRHRLPERGVVSPEVLIDQPHIPSDDAFEFAAIAPDPDELTRQWERFRLEGAPPTIDFLNNVMLFVGFGESGSCPYRYDGLLWEPDKRRLTFINGFDYPADCTSDYNARTLGVAVNRNNLPTGVFGVRPPNGVAPILVAAAPAERPHDEASFGFSSISEVFVVLSPGQVATDGQVQISLRNESSSRISTPRQARLDRWTGLGFEPANPPAIHDDGYLSLGRGKAKPLLTIDVSALGLEAGWYRITVDLSVARGGRLFARSNLEVTSPTAR